MAVRSATNSIAGHDLETYVEESRSGGSLPASVRSAIRESDLFVADLAGASPNVMYEVGYAHGLGRPMTLFTSDPSLEKVPIDLRDLTIALCPSRYLVQATLEREFTEFAACAVGAADLGKRPTQSMTVWFNDRIREVEVVCASEPEMSQFGRPDAENFLFIDQLEDRDALLEASMFISRARPHTRVRRHSSHSLSHDVLDGNIVVLGGPLNNHLTRDLIRILRISLSYRFENETAEAKWPGATPVRRRMERRDDGLILNDVGYFGRFRNPYNADAFIVMCQGFHTFGTLGAVALFGDDRMGVLNQTAVLRETGAESCDDIDRLEVFFNVEVMANRRIAVPALRDCDWHAE